MASISADTFVGPRIHHQTKRDRTIEFTDFSDNGEHRLFTIFIRDGLDDDEFSVSGHRIHLNHEGDPTGREISLPHKMTAALYRAAVKKGYAR